MNHFLNTQTIPIQRIGFSIKSVLLCCKCITSLWLYKSSMSVPPLLAYFHSGMALPKTYRFQSHFYVQTIFLVAASDEVCILLNVNLQLSLASSAASIKSSTCTALTCSYCLRNLSTTLHCCIRNSYF